LAAGLVAKAPPDGHTVLLTYSAYLSNLLLQPNPGYKQADFVPIGMLVLSPIAIGVRTSLGVNTLQELVAMAKAQPGKLSYGSYGQGSGGHFVGELFNAAAGIALNHIPYKGEAPALQDLLGGQIDTAIASIGGVSRYPGKIKPLAVASATRFPGLQGRAHLRRSRPARGGHARLGAACSCPRARPSPWSTSSAPSSTASSCCPTCTPSRWNWASSRWPGGRTSSTPSWPTRWARSSGWWMRGRVKA
jgi:hypothetical protein